MHNLTRKNTKLTISQHSLSIETDFRQLRSLIFNGSLMVAVELFKGIYNHHCRAFLTAISENDPRRQNVVNFKSDFDDRYIGCIDGALSGRTKTFFLFKGRSFLFFSIISGSLHNTHSKLLFHFEDNQRKLMHAHIKGESPTSQVTGFRGNGINI